MRKRWSRTVVIASLLSVPALGVAVSALQGARFADIPAGHWATEAVEYVTTQGLIQGYPDQTFKGTRTLTRYEAATIFYRLLRSGAMSNVSPQGQEVIQKGLDEVKAELAQVQAKLGTQDATNTETANRLNTLEQQIKNLPAPSAAPSTDLDARLKALEDKVNTISNQPAATPPPPAPPAPATTDLDARLTALENQVKTIAAQPAPAPANTADLEARLKALEDKVSAAPTAPAAPATDFEPRIAALEAAIKNPAPNAADAGQDTKIAALEAQVASLTSDLNSLKTQVAGLAATPPAAPPPPPPPAAVTPPSPPVDVTPPPPPPPAPRNFTIGLGASYPIIPSSAFSTSNINLAGFVGFKRLIGPIGVRANFDLNLAAQTLSIGPDLILTIGSGGFLEPYLGLGAGGVFGVQNSLFIRGIAGLNLNFSPLLGLWLEADPRFSPLQATNNFAFSIRAGLKLSF